MSLCPTVTSNLNLYRSMISLLARCASQPDSTVLLDWKDFVSVQYLLSAAVITLGAGNVRGIS